MYREQAATTMYSCEYLPRLATISVKIQVNEKNPKITGISLDGAHLSIKTAQSSYEAILPSRSSSDQPKIVNMSATGNVLALKMTVQSLKPTDSFMSLANSGNQRWSVRDLLKTPKDENKVNTFRFACNSCGKTIIRSNDKSFSDMPSEFWHELMDFWHCHKPHQDHHNQHTKNYEAIHAKPGHVYIGSSYFLVHKDQVSEECPNCHEKLGYLAGDFDVKLHKWNLALIYGDKVESYRPSAFAYYAILDGVNSGGLRKFVLRSARDSSKSLFIWVLNLGLSVSYLNESHENVLKILFAPVTNSDDGELLEIPHEVFESFYELLKTGNEKLPAQERTTEITENEKKKLFSVGYLYLD